MKKKQLTGKRDYLSPVLAQHRRIRARISLILAAVIVITAIGSAATAAIKCGIPAATVPSENLELNVAEQYLAKVAIDEARK